MHSRTGIGERLASVIISRAARSITAMAALLAHEVKNPLAGIKGVAIAGGDPIVMAKSLHDCQRE